MAAKRLLVALMVAAMLGGVVSSADAKGPNRPRPERPTPQPVIVPLSEQEALDLTYMREEEKLARDVYLAMDELYELVPFANIAAAEQRHMDSVGVLVTRYEIVDPVVDDTPGVFTDAALAALYTDLVDAGSVSYLDALMVGALIEEMDIVDLRETLLVVEHADLQKVYENLMRGSRNHLRTFAGLIAAEGAAYEAQYLTQEEFDEIAASPKETGRKQRGLGRVLDTRRQGPGDGTGPNGDGECDGTGPNGQGNGDGECDGTGPNGPGTGDGVCDGTGPNGNGAGNGDGDGECDGTGPNGQGAGDGTGPNGDGECDGTGPNGQGNGDGECDGTGQGGGGQGGGNGGGRRG